MCMAVTLIGRKRRMVSIQFSWTFHIMECFKGDSVDDGG